MTRGVDRDGGVLAINLNSSVAWRKPTNYLTKDLPVSNNSTIPTMKNVYGKLSTEMRLKNGHIKVQAQGFNYIHTKGFPKKGDAARRWGKKE